MITFLIGIAILILGGMVYGRVIERVMKPGDAVTPATRLNDGVDFVPMKRWKNSLVELLNIAGTGPILGPIQGALFGPIAFITIPIGCVIGGAVHDYMCGMISLRNDGKQMPGLIKQFLGKHMYHIYQVFVCLMMLLVAVVFIYTPGDIFVSQILEQKASLDNPVMLIVYGVIFLYYFIATLFPIDKIIGRIYPVFGAILLLSAVGVFAGLFIFGYPLPELWDAGVSLVSPLGDNFFPIFFVTVTCGIVSGFHSTQATLISRTVTDEREGRTTFYDMMIVEGFIAMVWAAAAMGALGLDKIGTGDMSSAPTGVVGIVSKDMLGQIGGVVAIIGVIVLPITSGDTALRSLRLMIGDALHIDQKNKKKALLLATVIFAVAAAVLIYAKVDEQGFSLLWRYFSWANETTAVFTFILAAVYMKKYGMPHLMATLPGAFYLAVVICFILTARIGFRLPYMVGIIVSRVAAVLFVIYMIVKKFRREENVRRTCINSE